MITKEILLFGAGGHAAKMLSVFKERGQYSVSGYISIEPKGTVINGLEVLGGLDEYRADTTLQAKFYHIAIGENSVRHRIYKEIQALDPGKDRLVTAISPHALLNPDVTVGPGTGVSHNAAVWNQVKIGICCIIDTGAIIEHNVEIGDFITISPGAVICGGAKIRDGAIVGAGATVIEKVTVGENSLIGAGSVVINDIEPNTLAVGNPARVIRKRSFDQPYLK